jgi:hypothetical protein
VAALEADMIAPRVLSADADAENAEDQDGDYIVPKTGLDIVEPGADNQIACDGAKTKVYALDSTDLYYPGSYVDGILEDNYIITILNDGPAGTATCRVENSAGTYVRNGVTVLPINWDDVSSAQMGMIDIGRNLFVVLHDDDNPSLELQAGDTYTFSQNVEAPWFAVSNSRLASGGMYAGPTDTTYTLTVERGGVFTRSANTIDGLYSPNKYVIDYSGATDPATETVTIDGIPFIFGTNVTVGIDADASMENLVDAINASASRITASIDTTAQVVTVNGDAASITGATNTLTGDVSTAYTATLVPVVDFEAWNAGDVDDEYVIRCTRAGSISSAEFTATSSLGDNQTTVTFTGTGSGNAVAIGDAGLYVYVDDNGSGAEVEVGDYWIVQVHAARPRVVISDTAGVDQGSYQVVTADTEFSVGQYGVTAEFSANRNVKGGFTADGGLVEGDVYYIEAQAEAEGPIKTLVLSDDLPEAVVAGLDVDATGVTAEYIANNEPSLFTVDLYLSQATAEVDVKRTWSAPGTNFTAGTDTFTVAGGIKVQDDSWVAGDGSQPWIEVHAADMFVEYRALIDDYSNGIYSLSSSGDVVDALGTIDTDNPLAQGVFNALANSSSQAVYFTAVPSDDLAGYADVLEQASKTDVVYAFAPVTTDALVLAAVDAHISELSTETNKRWRIAFFGASLEAEEVLYDESTFDVPGQPWLATVSDDPTTVGDQFTVVDITNGSPTLLSDVEAGDLVRVNFTTDAWGDEEYEEYEVAEVKTNARLELVTGPDAAISTASRIEIAHERSVAELATAVASQSSLYDDRRIYNVFPATAYLGGVPQGSEFIAAAIAGLVSAVPPQQGLTNISVSGFDDVPSVYRTYTRAQLNEMAGAGTFILMQDTAGGTIYVRHQVSTATSNGNILTTELNVTKNLDAISYYFANILEPYIGRYNITPELLDVLGTEISSGLNYLGSTYTGAGLLGPMLIAEGTALQSVEQHPTLEDHIIIIADLDLPLPVNVIQLRLVV